MGSRKHEAGELINIGQGFEDFCVFTELMINITSITSESLATEFSITATSSFVVVLLFSCLVVASCFALVDAMINCGRCSGLFIGSVYLA